MIDHAGSQRGNTVFGFLAGLVVGLGLATAVAFYITKAPVPFVTKVRPASESVDPTTAGDPNKPLYPPPPVINGDAKGTGAATPGAAAGPKTASVPPEQGTAAAVAGDGTRFQLQAGAFKSQAEAEGMRARLALLGFDSKIFPREQDGSTLYRVRLGPYADLEDVNRIRKTMAQNGIDVQLIRLK
jgi:cell division protein FtsN